MSGDIDNNDFNKDANGVVTDTANITGTNSVHVVKADGANTPITGTTVLDGFTISAGSIAGADFPNDYGGGFFCNGAATLSGTPTAANVSANPVQLRVQDKAGAFATQSFTITVAATEPITQTGSVQGKVQDDQGKGLAGATVTLTDESGAVAIATLLTQSTDSNGDYLFQDVPVGEYTITVSLDGMLPSAPGAVSV